jgi:excisionase family DNA binding protein
MNSLLSTKEVAGLLNLAESTIKRWADNGDLLCIKTLGGHRKFRMADLVKFADEHRYPLTGILPPTASQDRQDQLSLGVNSRNYVLLSEIFLEELLRADRNSIFEFVAYLYKHHLPFSVIAEEVIRPAMARLGHLWAEGNLKVDQEHLATQALQEALMRLAPNLHKKPTNGLTMVCACPESELHDLAARILACAFEAEGWTVQNLGANTPMSVLASYVGTHRPNAILLSTTTRPRRPGNLEAIQSIGKLARAQGGLFLVGGSGVARETPQSLHCDFVTSSVTDAIRYTRDVFQLKPGPKKREQPK